MSERHAGRTTRRAVAGALFAGWLVSLALPALSIAISHNTIQPAALGWEVLTTGAAYLGAFQFGWLANPLLLVLLALLAGRPWGTGPRITAILLALCTLDVIDLFLRPEYYAFRGAHAGFYLWMAVNLLAALAAVFFSMSPRPVAEARDSSQETAP